jgi:hypothetical protein
MENARDDGRSAICGVGDQVRIAGQNDKPISRAASQIRAADAELRVFPDAFRRSENRIEEALSCNRIVPRNPRHCPFNVTARPTRERCGGHLLWASMIA